MKLKPKQQKKMALLKLIMDCLLVPVVIILAYGVKFKVGWTVNKVFQIPFGQIYHHAQIEPYLEVMGVILFFWILSFYSVRLYQTHAGIMPEVDEIIRVIKGTSLTIFQIMAFSFVFKSFPGSRYVLLYTWIIGIGVFSLQRIILLKLDLFFVKRGRGIQKALIIGSNYTGQDLAEKIVLFPSYRMQYVGTLDEKIPEKLHYHLKNKFKLLGDINELQKIACSHDIDIIFSSKKGMSDTYMRELLQFCEQNQITLKIASDLAEWTPLMVTEDLDGLPILSSKKEMYIGKGLKRLFDIIGSYILLGMLYPLFF